jgi:hypothetical protein
MSNMPFIENKFEVFVIHTVSKTRREIIGAKI